MRRGQGLLGVTDADFCCGMRWPGDATGLSNRSSTSSNDPKNQYKNQNNNHYTSHQHLRTHLRGPSFSAFTSLVISSREIIKNHHDSFIRPDPFSFFARILYMYLLFLLLVLGCAVKVGRFKRRRIYGICNSDRTSLSNISIFFFFIIYFESKFDLILTEKFPF